MPKGADSTVRNNPQWRGNLAARGDFVVLLRSGSGTPGAPPAFGVVEELGENFVRVRWANGRVGSLRPSGRQWVAKAVPVDDDVANLPRADLRRRHLWASEQEEASWADQLEPERRDFGLVS